MNQITTEHSRMNKWAATGIRLLAISGMVYWSAASWKNGLAKGDRIPNLIGDSSPLFTPSFLSND